MNKRILYVLSIVLVFIFILTVNADTAVSNVIITPTGTRIIEKGEELQLGVTIQPDDATNKNVSWTSSVPAVATVDSATGKVTGVEYGSTVITVRSESEGHEDDAFVLVRPKITFDANGATLYCDNGTLPNDGSDRPLLPRTTNIEGVTHYYVDASMDKDYNVYQLFTEEEGIHCTMTYSNHTFLGWYKRGVPTNTRLEETATFATAKALSDTYVAMWEEQSVAVSSLSLTSSTVNTSVEHSEMLGVVVKPSNATNKGLNVNLETGGIATVVEAATCPVSFMQYADGGSVTCYNVTGVAKGTTTVTFTTKDGSNKSISATINVASATVPVTSIETYPKNLSLIVKTNDSSYTATETIGIILKPNNATNQNLNVVSSNTNIVTVAASDSCPIDFMSLASGGGIVVCYNVTAKAPGTAQIKVKLADGSLTEQVINVTVKEYVPVTNVSIVQESVTLAPQKSRVLQPIFTPSDATNQNITWTSTDNNVASVMTVTTRCVTFVGDRPSEDINCVSNENANSNVRNKTYMVMGSAAGTATLTATTEDGSKVATVQVTVNDTVDENVVSYDCNGGNGTMSSFRVSKNDKYKLDKSVCTKEGYTFKGWKIYSNNAVLKDSSSKDYEYADEAIFTNIFGSEKPNLTLKAVWVSRTVPNAKTGISKPIFALLTLAMISLVVFIALNNKKVDF